MSLKLTFGKRLKLRSPALLSDKINGPSPREHSNERGLARNGRIIPFRTLPQIRKNLLNHIFDARLILHVTAGDGPDQATVLGDAFLHGALNSAGNLVENPVI